MDVPTIQLVGPKTSRKEIESIYYEVFKLQRLPGSHPGEPELVAEVVSSLAVYQGQEESEMPQMVRKPHPTDVWPPRSRTPRRGRRGASVERSLIKARKAHQKALTMAAALEEEIEWLSYPSSGVGQKYGHILGAGTAVDADLGDKRGGTTRHSQKTAMPPISSITLPKGVLSPKVMQHSLKISIWRNHQNLGQRSPASSGGQPRVWRRRT